MAAEEDRQREQRQAIQNTRQEVQVIDLLLQTFTQIFTVLLLWLIYKKKNLGLISGQACALKNAEEFVTAISRLAEALLFQFDNLITIHEVQVGCKFMN